MKADAANLSVVDLIGNRLREDIISGRLASGEQLIEVDIADKYSASRNSIREVLHLLVRDGLATAIRHRGVFVRTFYEGDLQDIYTARRMVQLSAIRSGPAYGPTLLDQLSSIIAQARQAIEQGRWQDVGTLSLTFHQVLVSVMGSSLIDEFFLNISAQLRLIFTTGPDERIVQKPMWVEWEARIYECLVRGDYAEAESELTGYLEESQLALTRIVRRYKDVS